MFSELVQKEHQFYHSYLMPLILQIQTPKWIYPIILGQRTYFAKESVTHDLLETLLRAVFFVILAVSTPTDNSQIPQDKQTINE